MLLICADVFNINDSMQDDTSCVSYDTDDDAESTTHMCQFHVGQESTFSQSDRNGLWFSSQASPEVSDSGRVLISRENVNRYYECNIVERDSDKGGGIMDWSEIRVAKTRQNPV